MPVTTTDTRPLDMRVMDTIEPVGHIYRSHKDGVLEKDGGKIISQSFLVSEDVVGQFLFTEYQMREAIEKAVAMVAAESK